MATETQTPLKVIFFPFLAHGHMLPMVDMANLFASRNIDTTIFTTTHTAALIRPSLNSNAINVHVVPFPSIPGLPDDCEKLSMSSTHPQSSSPAIQSLFFQAIAALRAPFQQLLIESTPDCVVTDMFMPWTADVADDLNIPRLIFHGTSFFSLSAFLSVYQHKPFDNSDANDDVPFILPDLPHEIKLLKSQTSLNSTSTTDTESLDFALKLRESEGKSYGVVVNSFYELEPDYADHYRDVIKLKVWHVGPVSLVSSSKRADPTDHCLNWLDGRKQTGSVVYVCFGSIADFSASSVRELAMGLESSGCSFVWVVRPSNEAMLPEGFEDRTRGRGLVMRGWAPQTMILNHGAVGGFLTHCGWNSSLEGISAGLPMVTWPMFAEQFTNERLIVDVLRIGVSLGVKKYAMRAEEREVVRAEVIEGAVRRVMGEEEEEAAVERRRRARELGVAARRAVEVGGSSYVDMGNLMQELIDRRI